MPLRLAIVSPVPLDAPSGNAVTVARIAKILAARGHHVSVWQAVDASGDLAAEIRRHAPEIVHAFHAYRAGPAAARLARALGVPLVVTLTGTDVSERLADAATAGAVRDVLGQAAAITAFHETVAAVVREAAPELAAPISVVPQSTCLAALAPAGAPPASAPAIAGDPCILFPAGIRPVKRPLLPLEPLDALARRRPGTRLWYAGPALDTAEHGRLMRALTAHPWARYLGPVPHAAMPALYRAADIVLNCSASEGGMANAVLEAMALGRAVLAADIPGNRSLVEDGVTGLLFASAAELTAKAVRLTDDPCLRRRLGDGGRRLVTSRFTIEAEVTGYVNVYRHALAPQVKP